MRRREFVYGGGIVLGVSIAGCSEGDETEFESGDGNGGGDNDEPSVDDVEIVEHDMVVERGQYTDEVYVEGIVENNSGERLNYVEVTVRIYDENDAQLESYIDNTTDLDDGRSWAFEVMILEDPDDIDSYDIAVEDVTW